MRIAIDAMGGDQGVSATIPGIQIFLKKLSPELEKPKFLIFGPKEILEPTVAQYNLEQFIEIYDVQSAVLDTDHPYRVFQIGEKTFKSENVKGKTWTKRISENKRDRYMNNYVSWWT